MKYRLIGSKLLEEGLYVKDFIAVDEATVTTIPTEELAMGSTCVIPGGATYMWNETDWAVHVSA